MTLDIAKLRPLAESVKGRPFVFRGRSPEDGFDCLGFVRWMYEEAGHPLDIEEPETYPAAWWVMRPTMFVEGLRKHATMYNKPVTYRPGDVLCFSIGQPLVTHVGVLLSGEEFAHCFMGRGVMVSSMRQAYWRACYWGLARVLAAQPKES